MSTTQPEALRALAESGFTAADMATAAAQGFRDGQTSLPAAGQEPVAWTGGEEWERLAWHLCAEENGEESCGELIWEGGPVPEPWGERWLKYEGDAKRMIELVRKFAAPQPAVAAGWSEGIQAAAKLLEKKADDFAQQHGYDDMGSLSFGRGAHADAKLDYHSGLLELAEEVRAMNEHAVHPANDGTHVLMEHSGCGRGTQVDTLRVRLNPGDKVIFHQGPITRAMLKAAPLPPAPSTEGESNG